MPPISPFWFKQRQCRAEEIGDGDILKVSGPNLGDAFLRIERGEDNHWRAAMRLSADGPEIAATEAEFDNTTEAWEAAFELYRTHAIV